VLSTSGHIQALVNPPGRAGAESRASFRVAPENPADPQAWNEQAATLPGSWWPDYDAWLAERSGAQKAAPKLRRGAKAPGTYVLAN
jgi:poly(3-hydroxyalkanoate) synthetase